MRRAFLSTTAALALASAALAGNLTPPVGPVQGTMKPLNEVEPRTAINATNTPGDATSLFKITQSGSYYLTGNLQGVAGKTTILINANHVSIDLCGFTIVGGLRGIGVVAPPPQGVANGIAVRNGIIASSAGIGLDLGDTFNSIVEGVQVTSCPGAGMVNNSYALVTNCAVFFCSPCYDASGSVRYTNCVAQVGMGVGFNVANDCSFESCSVSAGDGAGFSGGDNNTLRLCTAENNGAGIVMGDGCTIERCTVSGSVANGIFVGDGVTVRECTVLNSGADGISAAAECSIIGNTCRFNGDTSATGTGIRVTGSGGVIEDNRVIRNNNYGIWISGTQNLVARNWSRGHIITNLYTNAGNDSGAVLNAPGQNFVNTNPWANFTH